MITSPIYIISSEGTIVLLADIYELFVINLLQHEYKTEEILTFENVCDNIIIKESEAS